MQCWLEGTKPFAEEQVALELASTLRLSLNNVNAIQF